MESDICIAEESCESPEYFSPLALKFSEVMGLIKCFLKLPQSNITKQQHKTSK